MVDTLVGRLEAVIADKVAQRLKTLVLPNLLIVDEFGYLPISRTGAILFFQLISHR